MPGFPTLLVDLIKDTINDIMLFGKPSSIKSLLVIKITIVMMQQ